MSLSPDGLGRIEKLFLDRDEMSLQEIAAARAAVRISLVCGLEVSASPTLQAAVLTAANVATRCFPGSVSLHLLNRVADVTLLVPWPGTSLVQAIRSIAPDAVVSSEIPTGAKKVVFGTRPDIADGLQTTFNGWAGAVAPADQQLRLAERDGCVLAGVTAGALAVSELFLAFARVVPEATYRAVGISLWRPDLAFDDGGAMGPAVEFLPAEFWSLGLGHLGQGYLWSLGLLPFAEPQSVNLVLNDFDSIVAANVETGMLTRARNVGVLKTRVAAGWLRRRGFHPRLVERRFDVHFQRHDDEPRLALCGFDGVGPRDFLDFAGFERVVECGLGDRFDNFHSMLMHALPIHGTTAKELWPAAVPASPGRRSFAEALASKNRIYREFDAKHVCGAVEIAGKGVAVPFVGAIAGTLAIAETLRMLHGGESFESIDLRLASPDTLIARRAASNYADVTPALSHQRSGALTFRAMPTA